jgi:cyclohexa-1,5-dienecarbonyl-CoA hydratase
MAHEFIKTEERFDGQVIEIALGPPPANIVTAGVMGEVAAELTALGGPARSGVKLLVIRGEGDHFSYGASVEEHKPDQVGDKLPRFHALIRQLMACPVPSLAMVSGLCLGGGFEVALACSMVAADEGAKFGVPEIKLGVFPPAASVLLAHKVPGTRASEIVLTGRNYPARDMHGLGIVNRLAEAGTLRSHVDAFIEKDILPKSASSLRLAWQAVRRTALEHYDANIGEVERLYLDTLMSTKDAVEGIEAFLDKRQPKWQDA